MRGDDFAELYRDCLPRVLNYMRVRTSSESEAQDLTAATFERAFAKRRQLRNKEAFLGWAFQIARNELRQHYRRRGGRVDVTPLSEAQSVSNGNPEPQEAVTRREQLDELLSALEQLTQREQEIIRLKFIAGLRNRSIARAMGLSDGNVAVILYRALRKLRRALEAEA